MALTPTEALGILKERYPARKVQYVGYRNNVLLALIPKDTSFTGSVYDLPIWYGGNQGGSRTFANAQANKTSGLFGKFLLTTVKDYGLTSVSTEAILATLDDVGAFLKATTTEIDNSIRMAAKNLNSSLYGNFGGARGQVGSVSTVTLTLKNINDVVKFEVGMKVVSSTTDGTSGSVGAVTQVITAIDASAGTLTCANTWTSGGEFANDSYIFRDGDFGVSISGFDSWFPSAAPSATAFFGQNRSTNSRLYGLRYDGSAENIDEALQSADNLVAREGGELSHIFMNHADHIALRKSLGSKVIYDKVTAKDMASIGFKAIMLDGSGGQVAVLADRDCPSGIAYGVTMDSLILASRGPCPRFLRGMGQDETIWDYNADSVEFRSGYYAQMGCHAPNQNIRIALPTG
jgi:hypothetical protein